jgi:hypothetical protein
MPVFHRDRIDNDNYFQPHKIVSDSRLYELDEDANIVTRRVEDSGGALRLFCSLLSFLS